MLPKEELKTLLWEKPMTQIGKQFGVAGNTIKKWTKLYGLEKPPGNYWAKIAYDKKNKKE